MIPLNCYHAAGPGKSQMGICLECIAGSRQSIEHRSARSGFLDQRPASMPCTPVWHNPCEFRIPAALNETILALPSAARVSLKELVVYQAHLGGSPGGQPYCYCDEHIIL